MMFEDYVSRIERLCGPGNDYLVVIRYDRRDEVIKRLLDSSDKLEFSSKLMWRVIFRGKRVNIFKTGKFIIKNLEDEDELRSILGDILV